MFYRLWFKRTMTVVTVWNDFSKPFITSNSIIVWKYQCNLIKTRYYKKYVFMYIVNNSTIPSSEIVSIVFLDSTVWYWFKINLSLNSQEVDNRFIVHFTLVLYNHQVHYITIVDLIYTVNRSNHDYNIYNWYFK